MTAFQKPVRATHHCRHYSYNLAPAEGPPGPVCAINACDMSAPGASAPCMPGAAGCPARADYTEEERAAWQAWTHEYFARLTRAISALPAPIPLRSSGKVGCPNCGGELGYTRWAGGAWVNCSTADCCSGRFSIESGADWPTPPARHPATNIGE